MVFRSQTVAYKTTTGNNAGIGHGQVCVAESQWVLSDLARIQDPQQGSQAHVLPGGHGFRMTAWRFQKGSARCPVVFVPMHEEAGADDQEGEEAFGAQNQICQQGSGSQP